MYIQCIKDDGYNSSYQPFIIPRLLRFKKLALSQFQLYIEAQTTIQCFVCSNFQKTISIQVAAGKEKVSCILHMLSIHSG